MATALDIEHIRGDDRLLKVTYPDRGDLTGATIKYTVKDRVGGTQMFQSTVGFGITVTDGPNGVFEIGITPANTSGKAPGDYLHDCEVTIGGKTDTVLLGDFKLIGDVS